MSNVVIVGAGPAGASLAYLLSSRGVEVTLLERQRDFSREFRGEILLPSGIDAIEQMGVGPQMRTLPSYAQQSLCVYINGQSVLSVTFDSESSKGPRFLAVSQPALLEMLVSESAQFSPFRLVRGAPVKELLVENGRVVGVIAATDIGDEAFRADLVIGADGRSSSVRKHAKLSVGQARPPMDIVWCKLPCPADWKGIRAYAGRGHLLVAYHTWDDTLQLGWVILKGTFGELRGRGIEDWVEEMANHVSPDFAVHLRANRDAVQKPFLLSTSSDCVDAWSGPGVMVIGDAAHTMSPVGGQGINIALRDSIVAANHLVPVLASTVPDPNRMTEALEAIEIERMHEVRLIQKLQALPPKLILSHAWWGEPMRRIAGAVLRSPMARLRAGKTTSAFLYGVTDVRLEV